MVAAFGGIGVWWWVSMLMGLQSWMSSLVEEDDGVAVELNQWHDHTIIKLGNINKKVLMMLLSSQAFDAHLQIAPDTNEPNSSHVEDADLTASQPNTFFNPSLVNWNWDEVILIPSDDDEANVNEPNPLPIEDADVEANSETNISSHIIDVHVDVEELARAATAKLDRIWVDLVRKEIKSLLDIIDAAEHRIESDTNIDHQILSAFTKLDPVFNPADVDTDIEFELLIDTIGRVIRGGLKQPKGVNTCEIWLRHLTGAEIKFVSIHTLCKVVIRIAKVVQQQGTIYLTRVMLVHTKSVDSFASITNPHAYYNMDKVRVDFVSFDRNANKLYYFLNDKHDEKITAKVPPNLVASYKEKDFAQTFVSINNFQVGYFEDIMIGVTQSSTGILTPIHVDLNKEIEGLTVTSIFVIIIDNAVQLYLNLNTRKWITCHFEDMMISVTQSSTGILTPIHVDLNKGGIYHKVDQLVPRDGEPRVELTTSFKDDQRLYNHPTTFEVAGIWVEGNENITTYKSGIVVYGRSKYPTHIQAYFACYALLSYPILFPNGKDGWHKRIPRAGVDIRELIGDDDDEDDGVKDEEVHLPNNQLVSFREDDVLTDILNRERNKRSMLTAFFELNKTDPNIRQYLYRDIPRAVLEKGLIKSDNYIHACLREASTHELPYAFKRLFATLLIFCEPRDVRKLWDDHYESLSEDYNLNCTSVERVKNTVLTDISAVLQSMGRSLSDFDLPNITVDVRPYAFGCCEVHEECSIVVLEEDILARHSLNTDQKNAYDTIMRHVDADSPGVFFIDGPGGTGKMFLYKTLLANVCSRGLIALATALSGAAANNMTGGRTTHSRFKIPINLTTDSMCNIKKESSVAKLLCQAKLIIWDEASMTKRQAV
uniref:ATP-dependent DNA helicase n=1 Tax=Tanacetum cinerariifolium TaxID=118510 RepID=A0A6L2JFA5_TANCI|nr:hypothetical protein [Tanacetum cinerariifolium]